MLALVKGFLSSLPLAVILELLIHHWGLYTGPLKWYPSLPHLPPHSAGRSQIHHHPNFIMAVRVQRVGHVEDKVKMSRHFGIKSAPPQKKVVSFYLG